MDDYDKALRIVLDAHAEYISSSGKSGRKFSVPGANLTMADLTGADLSFADMSNADLRWVKTRGADVGTGFPSAKRDDSISR